jgi:hypothetical protein
LSSPPQLRPPYRPRAGEDGEAGLPRRRDLLRGSAPATRVGGGDGRRGLLASSHADLSRPPPARRVGEGGRRWWRAT